MRSVKGKKSDQGFWCLVVPLGTLAALSLIYFSFSSGVETNYDKLRSDLLDQTTFMTANKKNQPIPVSLKQGQTVQGFTVSGTYYTSENSWSGKVAHIPHPYTFYVMPTISKPPFFISVPDIQNEGVSRDIYDDGMFEAETHTLFEHILNNPEDGCRTSSHSGNPPLVLDVGANLGWFSAFSSAAGCRVTGVEPQPRMLTLINVTLELNDLQSSMVKYDNEAANQKYPRMKDRVQIKNNIINTDTSQRLKIIYNNGACWACSHVTAASPDEKSTSDQFIIPAIRIEEIIKEDVLLMKIDIEGYEVRGLESAWPALQRHNVKNILIEWTPKRWGGLNSVDKGTQILEQLYDIGYTIRHYDLRMDYPKDGLKTIEYAGGKAWEIPRSKLSHMNNYLLTTGYGEANLWMRKER